jgi:hypothetical protein
MPPDDPFPLRSVSGGPPPASHSIRFPTLELYAASHGNVLALHERRLTPDEVGLATGIFGGSLWYDRVRIVAGLVVNAPTTLGNYIRVSIDEYAHGMANEVLIHELTHVWQFQTKGTGYISNSLYHQLRATLATGSRSAAYDLDGAQILQAGSIVRLSAEKQAMLVEYWFMNQVLDFPERDSSGKLKLVSHPIRDTKIGQAMITEVRNARPLPQELIFEEAAWGPGMNERRHALPSDHDVTPIPLIRFEF